MMRWNPITPSTFSPYKYHNPLGVSRLWHNGKGAGSGDGRRFQPQLDWMTYGDGRTSGYGFADRENDGDGCSGRLAVGSQI